MPKKLVKSKKNKDSDEDGLSDYDEVNYFGSDPYNSDSDGDGVEDGEAVLNGKDPVGGGPLKDFFIPHAGNNYKPKALRPKRLLFHGIAAVCIKAVVVIFITSYPLLAWMTPDIAAAEGQKIIALTNELRSSLSLKILTESSKLDAAAVKKVENMFINQYFAHVSPQGLDLDYFLNLAGYKDYAVAGENLAMGYKNAAEAMSAWKASPTHYANLIDENYSQIGVGLADGLYFNKETVFIAQYFALPSSVAADEVVSAPSVAATKKVLSAPLLSREQAKITIDTPAGNSEEKVVRVEAVLPVETKSAVAQVDNMNIALAPVPTSTNLVLAQIAEPQESLWVGQEVIISESAAEHSSVVPPTIIASDNSGNVAQVMVSPDSVQPQKTSFLEQYLLLKTHPSKGLAGILQFSSVYFQILLVLVTIILLLNIFIKIRKQYPKLIMSGIGLIMLLVILIVF